MKKRDKSDTLLDLSGADNKSGGKDGDQYNDTIL